MADFFDSSVLLVTTELQYFIRILIAGVCGALIGVERSHRQKEAGVRTHTIIALTAALLMVLSKYAFTDLEIIAGVKTADGARIAAQIVTAVGFIGAGVIFRNGNSLRGLTTAAGMWATSAIGMTIGSGMYITGVAATIALIGVNTLFHNSLKKIESTHIVEITAILESLRKSEEFRAFIKANKLHISAVNIHKNDDETIKLKITASIRGNVTTAHILSLLGENEHVKDISIVHAG